MGYRFVKITTYYDAYLDYYYSQYLGITRRPYQEQYDHLMADCFGWADFFSKNLRKIGVEAHEIVANTVPLQETWAAEHGTGKQGKELVLAQLKALEPDVVLFENPFIFGESFPLAVKEQVSSIKQTIGVYSSPYSEEQLRQFRIFDFTLAFNPGQLIVLRELGIRSYSLYHAFEPTILPIIKSNNDFPETNVCFVGGLAQGCGFHNRRIKVLEGLSKKGVNLSVFSTRRRDAFPRILVKETAFVFRKILQRIGLNDLGKNIPGINRAYAMTENPRKSRLSRSLVKCMRPPLFGIRMFKALYRSRIGFNIHIDGAGEYCGNMRMFEVTGVGSCLVTDHKRNIKDLFEPDLEVATYNSVDECVEKISWLLEHAKERERIAKAGQRRTLSEHTYEQRAIQLDSIIRDEFS